MKLSIDIENEMWKHLEYLGLHCFKTELFCKLINNDCNIIIPKNLYSDGDIDLEHYIEHEESKFINFIISQNVHSKARVIEKIYFHPKVEKTDEDTIEFGAYKVRDWRPKLKEELKQVHYYVVDEHNRKVGVKIASLEKLITFKFKDFFLDHLCNEINDCFTNQFFIGSIILCRKLCETLVLHVLMKQLSSSPDLWWDARYKQPKNFGKLINCMLENMRIFNDIDRPRIESICTQLRRFKDYANEVAHNENNIPNAVTFEEYSLQIIILNLNSIHDTYCGD